LAFFNDTIELKYIHIALEQFHVMFKGHFKKLVNNSTK
jgi:hypothetical protein